MGNGDNEYHVIGLFTAAEMLPRGRNFRFAMTEDKPSQPSCHSRDVPILLRLCRCRGAGAWTSSFSAPIPSRGCTEVQRLARLKGGRAHAT